ncbi:MAG: hypothetical protein GXO57_06220 [Thermodesulfobacteria bacterium]|nr:hypothetical protein [Thermodesulfobacteriota bacterium]
MIKSEKKLYWIIYGFIMFFILSFVSCNISEKIGISDKNSEDTCEYKVNYLLDKGQYDEVVNLLSPGGECANAMSVEEKDLNLAAAYLGKAGFTAVSIIRDILTSNSSTSNAYGSFIGVIADRASCSGLKYLNKALSYYEDILRTTGVVCNGSSISDPIAKEACFMKGVVEVARAGASFALMFKGNATTDIKKLIDYWLSSNPINPSVCDLNDINRNGIPDTADFSACAMDYAVHGSLTIQSCDDASLVTTGCTFGIPNKSFYVIKLVIKPQGICTSYATNATNYEVIENDATGNFAVLTDGYCYCSNGTKCNTLNATAGCYPCPLILDETTNQTATQVGTIVEALNEGSASIASVVSNSTDIQSQTTDFIKSFCEANATNLSQCACYDANGVCHACNDTDPSTGLQWIVVATDVKIGGCPTTSTATAPVVNATTQELIVNYLLAQ